MATVTAFDSTRSQAIEDEAIVSGAVVGDDLILTKNDTSTINAGNVRGPQGIQGPIGEVSTAAMNAAIDAAHAPGAIDATQLATDSVVTSKVAAGAITLLKMAVDSVDTNQVVDAAITLAKMAADSVDTAQIVDGAVVNAKLGNGSVDGNKLGAKVVANTHIADNTITTLNLGPDCITQAEVADDAVRYEHVNFIFVQSATPTGVTNGIWIDTN